MSPSQRQPASIHDQRARALDLRRRGPEHTLHRLLTSLESGQRVAIEAVTKFVETVDQMLPALGERSSRRQEDGDAAMEMADRLVHTQYEFPRKVVQSAGKTLNKPDDGK